MLRGVSILLVLLHHFNIAYPLQDTVLAATLGWPAVRAVARNGNYGVTIFFVISGFLITTNALERWGSLERIRLPGFYALRAARILPGLFLALLAVDTLALAGVRIFDNRAGAPVSLWTVNLAGATFWMNVLITQHGWINYPLGVLWSLSVEAVFYLLFPLACVGLRRPSVRLALALAAICIGPLYRYAHAGDEGGFLYAYPACFDAIAIGCCAAVLARQRPLPVLQQRAVRALVAAAMAALYLAWPIAQSHVLGVSAMALATALLLLGSGRAAPLSRPARALAACGRRSYEIYLFHLLVLGSMRTLMPAAMIAGDAKTVLLAAYLVLSVAVGACVAWSWSDPINAAWRRRWVRYPASAPSADGRGGPSAAN